jgi:hypothetical protein
MTAGANFFIAATGTWPWDTPHFGGSAQTFYVQKGAPLSQSRKEVLTQRRLVPVPT